MSGGYLGNPISTVLVQETKKEIFEFLATEGQTVFSGNDINGFTLEYVEGLILVSLNGTWLDQAEYTASNGTSITLTEGAYLNQTLKVLVFDSFDMINVYNKFQSDQKFLTSDPATARGLLDVQTVGESASVSTRNGVVNQEAVSQAQSSQSGMESLLGTAASGLTTTGGTYGYLKWVKNRTTVSSHALHDSVRGNFSLDSSSTAAETATLPNSDVNNITWTWQTTKQVTGVTNRNKAYTRHSNPDLGFSIVGYVGDGIDGHEIPHHLGVEPELTIIKSRSAVGGWAVQSPMFDYGDYLVMDTTAALANASTLNTLFSDSTIKLATSTWVNNNSVNYISYHFSSIEGVSKVGKYIGNGVAGNYVECGFKPAFVMVKSSTGVGNWVILDTIRGDTTVLYPNLTDSGGTQSMYSIVDGFRVDGSGTSINVLNSEYIFLALAESSIDATKALTDYSYPTTPDTLNINDNTLVSLANGFNANGQVDNQYQFGASVTHALGAGHLDKHYHLYTDKTGTLGVSEFRPLSGITRNDADKYGVVSLSDETLRTTSKHFDYESDSGISLASEEIASYESWTVFNKKANDIVSGTDNYWYTLTTTNSWLQYKHTEKRILKSWRMRESTNNTSTPRRFTIEGSNDGYNWTAIDSTYTASDYVGNGAYLWGDLQDISANTTDYVYHRINTTANNGHGTNTQIAELEFNTKIDSDYYLIEEAKMYDSSNTPIERVYLAEFKTDSNGDVLNNTISNYPIASQVISNLKVHEDLTVFGDINNLGIATAWVFFDLFQTPPLIYSSFNIKDVVDIGGGQAKLIFKTPMDHKRYILIGAGQDGHSVNYHARDGNTKDYAKVIARNSAGGTVDSIQSIIIFGGKKIQ